MLANGGESSRSRLVIRFVILHRVFIRCVVRRSLRVVRRRTMEAEPSYALRLSVKTTGTEPIRDLESSRVIEVIGRRVNVALKGDHLVLTAAEFASEADAERFLPRLRGGLWNLALEQNLAFVPYFSRRDITFADDPVQAARNLARSFGVDPDGPVHGCRNLPPAVCRVGRLLLAHCGHCARTAPALPRPASAEAGRMRSLPQ